MLSSVNFYEHLTVDGLVIPSTTFATSIAPPQTKLDDANASAAKVKSEKALSEARAKSLTVLTPFRKRNIESSIISVDVLGIALQLIDAITTAEAMWKCYTEHIGARQACLFHLTAPLRK